MGAPQAMPQGFTPGMSVAPGSMPPAMPGGTPVVGGGKSHHGSRLLLALVAVLIVLGLGGGYAFAFYLPSRPAAVYKTALSRTGQAVDSLTQTASNVSQQHYKGYNFDGEVKVVGPFSADATFSGSGNSDGSGLLTTKADIEGTKVTLNGRSIAVDGSSTPDIYLQVSGIKSTLDTLGLNSLDDLDGKWLSVDHTLLQSYASQVDQNAADAAKAAATPSDDQLQDALTKVQAVNKQYIFTTNSSTAVLANEAFIGKETRDGRATYHYKVGYNKQHLQDYVEAVGKALDSSQLNTWYKTANKGQNISSGLDVDSLKKDIAKSDASHTADVWVDKQTKVLHALQFTDPDDKSTTLTLTQNYTGGSLYPFTLAVNGKDSDGGIIKDTLQFTVNTQNNSVSSSLSLHIPPTSSSDSSSSSDSTSAATDVTLKLSVTPSSKTVPVTVPTGAESVTDLLNSLGLGADSLTSDFTDLNSI